MRLIIWDVHPEEVEKPWRAGSIYLGLTDWCACFAPLLVLTTQVQTKWYRTWIIIFTSHKTYTGFHSLVWFRLCSKNEAGGNELCKENPQTSLCLWLWQGMIKKKKGRQYFILSSIAWKSSLSCPIVSSIMYSGNFMIYCKSKFYRFFVTSWSCPQPIFLLI